MHKTIWLLAFNLQLLAINSGAFPRGFIMETVPITNNKTKNGDWKTRNANKEPNKAAAIGIKKENETAPAGVISRCVILIAS